MRRAEIASVRALRGEFRGARGDAVGLDVVGVSVAAVGVVGDEDLRAQLPDDLDEVRGGLVHVGGPEGVGPVVLLGAHHPGVAEATGAAEEPVVGDAQFPHGGGELADPVGAQGVVAVGGEMGEVRRDDLALLAQRAGHQGDVGALGRVLGHGDAVVDGLVVRVRVHEEQTTSGETVHGVSLRAES